MESDWLPSDAMAGVSISTQSNRTELLTFLFTDIEGSTRLAQEIPDAYGGVLDRHRLLLRQSFEAHGGSEVGTEGDSFFVVFASPLEALVAAAESQVLLARTQWPQGVNLRVRMGLHVGEAAKRNGDYVGVEVHRAARVASAGHGGQILLSEAMAGLIGSRLPHGIGLRDLGTYRLKDFDAPARLFQVTGNDLESAFPALHTEAASRTNLPPQLTSFVGRVGELSDLKDLVGKSRLVTLIGSGGSGKTRLMVEVAGDLLNGFEGVWLVELAPIANPELVVNEVARALGVPDETGRDVLEGVIDFLRSKSLLLLLDNCEHVIGAVADLVEKIFLTSPGLTVVASSREALGLAGEAVFQVPSLGLPRLWAEPKLDETGIDDWLDEVSASEAVHLFVERARVVLPSFSLNAGNARAVVDVTRRLDGIPLALELAAARVKLLSVDDIAVRLSDRFRLLTGGRRTALPRQQTLQALIDWSWDLLSKEEKLQLQRLAVFAGGWTLEAASFVTSLSLEEGDPHRSADTLDVLGHLVDRSLVVVDHGRPTRYRLLETIRHYSFDRLADAGEGDQVRARHLLFFLDMAVESVEGLRGPEMVSWLTRLDADADNFRAALDWAFKSDPESAIRLAVALNWYWRSRTVGPEASDVLNRAVEVARRLPPPAPDQARQREIVLSQVLAAAAFTSATWGMSGFPMEWADEALALARRLEDSETLSSAMTAVSVSTTLANVERASAVEDELIDNLTRSGDWWTLSFTEASVATWHWHKGDLAAAEKGLINATEAAERTGNPLAIAFTALTRGRVAGFMGKLPEARAWLGLAISSYQEMDDHRFVLIARSDLAHGLRVAGEVAEAEALYRVTLKGWREFGNRGAIANQLECLAYLSLTRGRYPRAARLLGAAEAIRQVAGATRLVYEVPEYEGAIAALTGAMGPDAKQADWTDGRRLTIGQAIDLALAENLCD